MNKMGNHKMSARKTQASIDGFRESVKERGVLLGRCLEALNGKIDWGGEAVEADTMLDGSGNYGIEYFPANKKST